MKWWIMFFSLALALSIASGEAGAQARKDTSSMAVESTAFANNKNIPRKYSCDGKDINPPLAIRNVPDKTRSIAVIVDDPDAPSGLWVHWVLWNIDPATTKIAENSVPKGAVKGRNDFKKTAYGGPCPPSGMHRYFFKVYALDAVLSLKEGSTRDELEKAMKGHILGEARLIGLYRR